MTQILRNDYIAEVTLSLDTSIYADADVLADTQPIAGAFIKGGSAILKSIVILDKDDQAGALDLVFLRSDTALGTENGAWSMTDADAEEIIAIVPVVAGDYVDIVNAQLAQLVEGDTGIGMMLENLDTSDPDIYIGAISRDTKTYTAAGIIIKVGLDRSY